MDDSNTIVYGSVTDVVETAKRPPYVFCFRETTRRLQKRADDGDHVFLM